jgi:hypothetical protein
MKHLKAGVTKVWERLIHTENIGGHYEELQAAAHKI